MSTQTYKWKRFWCPRGGHIRPDVDGYLDDPEVIYGNISNNPNCLPFKSIESTPCLVLLAEPGMGKTQTMQMQRQEINRGIEQQGDKSLWLDLRSYISEDRLVRDLFEGQAFRAWVDGSHDLHLFLDSLDEGLLRIETLAALLVDELQKYPVHRMSLRIACRTADWPHFLEEELSRLWGEKRIGVYELAPLRRIDVIEAAQTRRFDTDSFLREINNIRVVSFAIKPVTLEMLLNIYDKQGQFPPRQIDLYRDGCRLLCEETNRHRRAAKRIGKLSPQERMRIAGRIAAVTIFANRYAVWTDIDWGDIPDEDVTIAKLLEGHNHAEPLLSDDAIRETLTTGLFSSRGSGRMGWAHQTYAEFLAAWYLREQKVTSKQIMSLLTHPEDPDSKLIPQLYEAAAWLASMSQELFDELMQVDPEVLLRSNAMTTDHQGREALVASLLTLFDAQKLNDRDRSEYSKLAHPKLGEQLRPYIANPTKGWLVRRVAISIAEACQVRALQNDIVDVALDQSQMLVTRIEAAYAITRIADEPTKAKLKPLALGQAGDDPDNKLKGYGLRAVWPQHLTAKELFENIHLLKIDCFDWVYDSFVSTQFASHLQPKDLPIALAWAAKEIAHYQLHLFNREPINAIFIQAWEHLESPDVLLAFAKAALSQFRQHEYSLVTNKFGNQERYLSFRRALSEDDKKRRSLVKAILSLLPEDGIRRISWYRIEPPLVTSKDTFWLIDQLKKVDSEAMQEQIAFLINRFFDRSNTKHQEAIFEACQTHAVLADQCAWFLKPIELDSRKAKELKADHEDEQLGYQRPLLDPPPKERIALCLAEFDAGDMSGWWRLNMELTLEVDSTHYRNRLEPDLTTLPGWLEADEMTKGRIVEAAKEYVRNGEPNTSQWLGTNTVYRPAFAGYRALQLLMQKEPDFLSTVPPQIWQKWAAIILAYPISSGIQEAEPQHRLVADAYKYAPEEILETLLFLIDKENLAHDEIFIIRKVVDCWDKRLGEALLKKAGDKALKASCMGTLLAALLSRNVDGAREFAKQLIPLPLPEDEDTRARALFAARMLATCTDDAGWSLVWGTILQDSRFGKEVISWIAAHSYPEYGMALGKITEKQVADLYIWLVKQYPYAEDPNPKGVHTPTAREKVGKWKGSILSYLQNRGTYNACRELERIVDQFPEIEWLKLKLIDAQGTTRRRTWIPLSPTNLLSLITDQRARLVESGKQLLEVVIESLERLQADLQGETPAAIDLWNEDQEKVKGKRNKVTRYRPKDENRLSDYVKKHLQRDLFQRGVVVGREVEIRRGEGATGTGERLDIRVDAVSQPNRSHDIVSVIIEAKGCWHNELMTAMETQLVNRYLKDNRCQYGLYLVGSFYCEQWREEDSRKKQVRIKARDQNTLREELEKQAKALSNDSLHVRAFVLDATLR